MRQTTATERYNLVLEGNMSKKEFVRQMRLEQPTFITQFNGYEDTVQILKNKGMIFEQKKVEKPTKVDAYDQRQELNVSLDTLDRGIRYELQALGLQPGAAAIEKEMLDKATKKAEENIKKDPNHYINLLAGESSKTDKHDKPVEVKRGKGEVDTFNGMKKADLKESINKVADRYKEIPGVEQLIKSFIVENKSRLKSINTKNIVLEFKKYINKKYSTEIINEGRMKKTQGGKVVTENDYETGGYVEAMGPKFDVAVDRLVRAFEEWKNGPMTEPGMVPHAKNDVVTYIDTKLEEYINEAEAKDLDKDGDIDSDDYLMAKDKAIKKAMGKEEEMVKESVKSIIKKILSEEVISEAATNNLAKLADEYESFPGMKQSIIQLQDIVTDIEVFYDKTRDKIQKIYNTLGEIKNEEGLKVGGFLAPTIQSNFEKDLRPVTKKGFTKELSLPKVKTFTQDQIRQAGGELEEEPKQTVFSPVNEKKK